MILAFTVHIGENSAYVFRLYLDSFNFLEKPFLFNCILKMSRLAYV